MSDNTPDGESKECSSSNESESNAPELSDIKLQIDRTVKELNGVRTRQNKVRKNINRELHRLSPATSEPQQVQISDALRQLHQEEATYGDEIRELEKTLSDLWSRSRQLEGTPLPAWTPSAAEAEEDRLRWLLLDIKRQQMEAAEKCRASEDPAERSLHEARFNELRDQYNSAYDKLNKIREALNKSR